MLAGLAVLWLAWRLARRLIVLVVVLAVVAFAGAFAVDGHAPSVSAPSLGELEHHVHALTPQTVEQLLRQLGLHPAPLPPRPRCDTPAALPAPLCSPGPATARR